MLARSPIERGLRETVIVTILSWRKISIMNMAEMTIFSRSHHILGRTLIGSWSAAFWYSMASIIRCDFLCTRTTIKTPKWNYSHGDEQPEPHLLTWVMPSVFCALHQNEFAQIFPARHSQYRGVMEIHWILDVKTPKVIVGWITPETVVWYIYVTYNMPSIYGRDNIDVNLPFVRKFNTYMSRFISLLNLVFIQSKITERKITISWWKFEWRNFLRFFVSSSLWDFFSSYFSAHLFVGTWFITLMWLSRQIKAINVTEILLPSLKGLSAIHG